MRAKAIVDLSAIKHNVKSLQDRAQVPVMAVLKADAYGHGLIPVARAALEGGAQWLGTALLSESIALREAGITQPRVMSWLTPPGENFQQAISLNIDLSASSLDVLDEIAAAARMLGQPARVHLEVDTGMTRGGALGQWSDLVSATEKYVSLGLIKCAGVWSHFARADEPGHPANAAQRTSFDEALTIAEVLKPEVRHLSNSAATLVDAQARYDLVRTGIAMYGLSPDVTTMGSAAKYNLLPAMSLTAKLLLVKDVPGGVAVSYGGTAITKSATKVGVVAMGYADGVPRHASNSLSVSVDGKVVPVLGRICMDQFVIDLGRDSLSKAGDDVLLFGDGGPSVDDWAAASGTINYEIVTRIGPRVERVYR